MKSFIFLAASFMSAITYVTAELNCVCAIDQSTGIFSRDAAFDHETEHMCTAVKTAGCADCVLTTAEVKLSSDAGGTRNLTICTSPSGALDKTTATNNCNGSDLLFALCEDSVGGYDKVLNYSNTRFLTSKKGDSGGEDGADWLVQRMIHSSHVVGNILLDDAASTGFFTKLHLKSGENGAVHLRAWLEAVNRFCAHVYQSRGC
ncbi:hypothetical protein LZ32DRAFT_670620 [Colletotrichum eremochloae]|nr:hypothetical protein LZ32DRAFT_670620 [Colletotrichum eremochloae]